MIVQSGEPPYEMRCLRCGLSWDPEPVTQGLTKGTHTDASLNKAANNHRCKTTGETK